MTPRLPTTAPTLTGVVLRPDRGGYLVKGIAPGSADSTEMTVLISPETRVFVPDGSMATSRTLSVGVILAVWIGPLVAPSDPPIVTATDIVMANAGA